MEPEKKGQGFQNSSIFKRASDVCLRAVKLQIHTLCRKVSDGARGSAAAAFGVSAEAPSTLVSFTLLLGMTERRRLPRMRSCRPGAAVPRRRPAGTPRLPRPLSCPGPGPARTAWAQSLCHCSPVALGVGLVGVACLWTVGVGVCV